MHITIMFLVTNYVLVPILMLWSSLFIQNGQFGVFWDIPFPHVTPKYPKNGSNNKIYQKRISPSSFSCKIMYLCQFSGCGHCFWRNDPFDPHLPLWCPLGCPPGVQILASVDFWKPYDIVYQHAKEQKGFTKCTMVMKF